MLAMKYGRSVAPHLQVTSLRGWSAAMLISDTAGFAAYRSAMRSRRVIASVLMAGAPSDGSGRCRSRPVLLGRGEIGRASCRGRVDRCAVVDRLREQLRAE